MAGKDLGGFDELRLSLRRTPSRVAVGRVTWLRTTGSSRVATRKSSSCGVIVPGSEPKSHCQKPRRTSPKTCDEVHGDAGAARYDSAALAILGSRHFAPRLLAWRRRPETLRSSQDLRLLTEIRASYEASKRTYGSPRMAEDLWALGYRVSRKRIERIMQETACKRSSSGASKGRWRRRTITR